MRTPIDFLGHEIKPGDLAVYPVRTGSRMWLSKLNVTQVLPGQIRGYNASGRLVTVQNLANVIVAPAPRMAAMEPDYKYVDYEAEDTDVTPPATPTATLVDGRNFV